jgi:3',5'-cyclic-AMP phosphodiesterase
MPIHLPALTRRQFLLRSLTAVAGVALSPSLFAASKRTDKNSWALFSDTHLAADRSTNARGINMTQHFEIVSRDVLALPKRPAGLFVSGDCAYNSGESGDYRLLSELLLPIRSQGTPVHLALGNHDNRERFWEALETEKTAKRPMRDRQVALIKTSRVNWFLLDSLEKTLSTPGLLGPEQLDWLTKALDANSSKPAIVMAHHNPGIAAEINGLKDTQALFAILRPRKQVKAFIFGHTHFWNVQKDESGIHLVNLPPVAYVFRDGNPAGWVHARVEAKAMLLELRCIDSTHKANGQTAELTWR